MHVYLETDRLVLRRVTEDDVDNLTELDSDPEVMRFLTGKPTARETIRDEVLPAWLAYYEEGESFGYWAAIDKATGDFLGWFHFRAHVGGPPRPDDSAREGIEIGYRLRREWWGKGYATEGVKALIRKGFTELGVERVYAETMTINAASRKVMEKAGLRYTQTFHLDWPDPIPGDEHGEVEYALTKAEWEA